MNRLHKFLRLATAERRQLLEAVSVLAGVRLRLWLSPFRTVQAWARRAARRRAGEGGAAPFDQVGRAVRRARRCVPAATCLCQALAAQTLLGRRGVPAQLRIGVARGPQGQLHAHAWLEADDRIVFGEAPDQARFTPLPQSAFVSAAT